ncbi:MAG: tetratricopeptide repeat protein [Deltaproteobacteria bacterium]|nr:tetratricopeptide repeat protein [Deltaproteobacteria bacterium]
MMNISLPFDKSTNRWLIYLIIFTVIACYLPVLSNEFVWDDVYNLIENPNYRGFTSSHLSWMFTTFYDANYHPLCWLTLAIDFLLWDMNPAGYHLTNLVIHLLNCLLLYFLAGMILRRTSDASSRSNLTGIQISAAIGALFFALHPLRVESVAWVSTRGDLLCGFFTLLTVISYMQMNNEKQGDAKRKWFFLSLLFFTFSLLSRAWGITLPVVLLILDIYPLRRLASSDRPTSAIKKLLIEKTPFTILALGAAILAFWAKKGPMISVAEHGIIDRFMQAGYGLFFYLAKTIAPVRLSPLYILDKTFNFMKPEYILCTLFVIALTIFLIIMRNRWPGAIAAWGCYMVSVSPLLGFVQSGPQVVADRYTYIASLPFGILVAAGIFRLWTARRNKTLSSKAWLSAAAVVVASLVVLSVLSFRQIRIWHDNHTYWEHVLQLEPANYLARSNRGYWRMEQETDFAGALADFNAAIRLNPNHSKTYYNRGILHQKRENIADSLADYNTAIRLNPVYAGAYNNRGILHESQEDFASALADFNTAIRLNPNYSNAYYNRGILHQKRENIADALADYNTAIRLNPEYAGAYNNRGILRERQGDIVGALTDFYVAIYFDPFHPDAYKNREIIQTIADIRSKLEKHEK